MFVVSAADLAAVYALNLIEATTMVPVYVPAVGPTHLRASCDVEAHLDEVELSMFASAFTTSDWCSKCVTTIEDLVIDEAGADLIDFIKLWHTTPQRVWIRSNPNVEFADLAHARDYLAPALHEPRILLDLSCVAFGGIDTEGIIDEIVDSSWRVIAMAQECGIYEAVLSDVYMSLFADANANRRLGDPALREINQKMRTHPASALDLVNSTESLRPTWNVFCPLKTALENPQLHAVISWLTGSSFNADMSGLPFIATHAALQSSVMTFVSLPKFFVEFTQERYREFRYVFSPVADGDVDPLKLRQTISRGAHSRAVFDAALSA